MDCIEFLWHKEYSIKKMMITFSKKKKKFKEEIEILLKNSIVIIRKIDRKSSKHLRQDYDPVDFVSNMKDAFIIIIFCFIFIYIQLLEMIIYCHIFFCE